MLDYETTRTVESTEFPGVTYSLYRMTEKRRRELRAKVAQANKVMRDLMRQQGALMKQGDDDRDEMTLVELQEKFDQVVGEELNPAYVLWGVQKIAGLSIRGQELGVEDWAEWPSALFEEVLAAVKAEAEMNGSAKKPLSLATISGDPPVPETQKPTTVKSAKSEGTGTKDAAFTDTPIM
jgi:hypothetical protein